jgi:hypothetical protein
MNLDEVQRAKVAAWIAEGLKLSDIQNRLASELGVTMTYMDVRFLVDDLKLIPKDTERPKAAVSPLQNAAANPPLGNTSSAKPGTPSATPSGLAGISVSVDQVTRPGAMVSGKVTFGDGNKAAWYLDEMGRLGLAPEQTGYRPPAAELKQFQIALEQELSKTGL